MTNASASLVGTLGSPSAESWKGVSERQFASPVLTLITSNSLIAEHACQKYSGRVGRSASAKDFDEDAVRLAVLAHIRHVETDYDAQLMRGVDRSEARASIRAIVEAKLAAWAKR